MNTTELKLNILNGQSVESFISLLLWGLLGLIASLILEGLRHKDKIKRNGGFSLSFWLKDNLLRCLISIISILVGVSFGEDITGFEIGNKGAFFAGLINDKIVEALIKFKSNINISSLWSKK
jgi:hypothetical protein